MKSFSELINDILNNEKLLRDIRTGTAVVGALSLAIIYWAFLENFSFTLLQFQKVLALTFIFTISVMIVRLEFKSRAFVAEIENNEDLRRIEKELFEEDVNIQYDEYGIEFVGKFNREGQEKANRLKTENIILNLMQKRRDLIRRGRPTNALDKKIEHIKAEPEVDTKYKPIRYTDLISKSSRSKNDKDVLDRDNIYYDPVKSGNITGFMATFARSVIPGSLGIGFLLDEPFINIVLYYLALLIAFAWTISTQYTITRKNTKTRYYETRKNKLVLIREMKKYIESKLQTKNDFPSSLEELFKQQEPQYEQNKI
jgi:hypothetical protein